jgi:hypothetical protein
MVCRTIIVGLLLASLVSFSQTPGQQGELPECPGSTIESQQTIYWDHCKGTRTEANGKKYVGEFHENKYSGQGTLTLPNGENYVGEFHDGKYSRGTLTFPKGDKYVGEFGEDERYTGQAILTFSNVNSYIGEFRHGRFNGQGTYRFANGDKYVGEFRDGKFNGRGTYYYSNGDKYFGEFRDHRRNGLGTYTFSNGQQKVGLFKDGQYIGFEVTLQDQNGVLLVPVLINNKIPLDFILDSGAADVSVPADVVLTLMRTGTLTEADFTGAATYTLADGSKVPSQTFRIRSLKVGDTVLENVSGSVASVNGSLLLGQSFLSRFKSWSIDNVRKVLVLQ